MTELFKPMPFGFPRGERQNRIQSVEGLDSALVVQCPRRRILLRRSPGRSLPLPVELA